MQNALLVGLSRQVALGRRARRGREQHRQPQHHRLQGRRRAVRGLCVAQCARRRSVGAGQPGELRARPRHLARLQPGRAGAHRQPARRRDRRQGLPGGRYRERRALHPQWRAADQRQGRTGYQRRRSGAWRERPDPLPAHRQRHHHQQGRHHQRALGRQQRRIRARQSARGQLRQRRPTAKGRHQLFRRRQTACSPIRTSIDASCKARSRNPTSAPFSK